MSTASGGPSGTAPAKIEDEAPNGGAPDDNDDGQGAEVDDGRDGKQALSRDELYARLGAVDDPDGPPAGEGVDHAPQVEDEASVEDEDHANPDAPPPVTPAGEGEQPPEPNEPTAEDPPPVEAPETPQPKEHLLGRVPDSEWRKLPKETRERINALRADRREMSKRVQAVEAREPLAKYGESVLRFAEQAKMSDDDLAAWLDVGAEVQAGGETAVHALLAMAKNLGWTGEGSPRGGTPAKLPSWLQEKVDGLEISPEAAQDIAARMPAETAPNKRGEQPREKGRAPRFGPDQQAIQQGAQLLAERTSSAERRFGAQWVKLQPQVQREMLKSRGASPETWGMLFDKAVDLVVERNRTRAPRTAGTGTLQPSAGKGGPPAKTAEDLVGRERLYAKYSARRAGI